MIPFRSYKKFSIQNAFSKHENETINILVVPVLTGAEEWTGSDDRMLNTFERKLPQLYLVPFVFTVNGNTLQPMTKLHV